MILQVDLEESLTTLEVDFGEIHQTGTVPSYDGPYTVTPTVEGRSLLTAGKKMDADVTIRPIPYYDVTNAAGGSTVYIGKEIP